MARGLFTLKQQLQGLQQKAWNTPVGTYSGIFENANQYLSVPNISAYTLNADFTIEFWANATSYPSIGGGSPAPLSGTNTTNNWLVLVDSTTIAFYWNVGEITSTGVANVVGSWFHVAIVRSGSTVAIYKNGIRLSSATNSSSFTLTNPLFIGQQNTGVGSWRGQLSNVRIVKGTAVYTSNFAPPIAPLAAITNTSLLTLQNATIVDNSTNAATITNGNSVTTIAAMPFTQLKTPAVDYLVVAGGGSGAGQSGSGGGAGGLLQGSVPVTAGSSITVTVGAGGNAVSGAGNVGNNSAFSSISASGGGGGQTLNGGTGGSGGSGGGANLGPSDVAGFGGQGVFGQGNKGGNSGTRNGQALGAGGGGAGTVGLDTVPASGIPGNGGAGISSAISGTVTAYAGGGGGSGTGGGVTATGGVGGGGAGAPCSGGGTTGTAGTTNTGGGGGAGSFGAGVGAAGGSGIVILSYPDIYAGAAATTGSPTVSTSGSGSIAFNGSTDYLKFPVSTSGLIFGSSDFTVEGWVYRVSGTGTTLFLYGQGDLGTVPNSSYVFYLSSSTNSEVYIGTGTYGTTSPNPSVGSWSHVAYVRTGGTFSTYLNGTRVGTIGGLGSGSVNTGATSYQPSIAAFPNNTFYLNGYISNVRVIKGSGGYNAASSTIVVPTVPLTAVTNTQLLLNTVSGSLFLDGSTNSLVTTLAGTPAWNQASPFATGLGYKNRVYTYTGSGTITF